MMLLIFGNKWWLCDCVLCLVLLYRENCLFLGIVCFLKVFWMWEVGGLWWKDWGFVFFVLLRKLFDCKFLVIRLDCLEFLL